MQGARALARAEFFPARLMETTNAIEGSGQLAFMIYQSELYWKNASYLKTATFDSHRKENSIGRGLGLCLTVVSSVQPPDHPPYLSQCLCSLCVVGL